MSKLAKICAIKSIAITRNPATVRRHLIARIIITLLLSSMLVVACGPDTPSSSSSASSSSPDTNSSLETGTNTPTATPKTTKGSTQSASSTNPLAPPTAAGKTQPGSNSEQATATTSTQSASSAKPPAPPSGGKQPPAGPDKSNPPSGPAPVVEALPSSFSVTEHEFDPSGNEEKNSQQGQPIELKNADQAHIIKWSVLITMFKGANYGWLTVSSSNHIVPPGKQGQPGISNATIIASVSSTMPAGEYTGCVEFLPSDSHDHCVNDGANAFDETYKEVFVKLTIDPATSTSTSPPAAQPTPTSQEPVAPPTPPSQQIAPPTPTPTSEQVAPPTPTPQEPVAPPTPTSQQPVAPPTSTST